MRVHGLFRGCALAAAFMLFATDIGARSRSVCFTQQNLVSDQEGVALTTDSNLVNSWGIVATPGDLLVVADNGTGVSTVYGPKGQKVPLVITIPAPPGQTGPSAPTGVAFNRTSEFVLEDEFPSLFLYATEDGTIAAWHPLLSPITAPTARIVIDNSGAGAVYKGIDVGVDQGEGFIYAANFVTGEVEQYDTNFDLVTTFTARCIAQGTRCVRGVPRNLNFAPFNVAVIEDHLFVMFAVREEGGIDDVAGEGFGFIDEFTLDGTFVRRFASGAPLNAPWGIALAPPGLGRFSGKLLIGNFGDGRINAFDFQTGAFFDKLRRCADGLRCGAEADGPVTIDGLWGLTFLPVPQQEKPALYFASGPDDESHGLVGRLKPTF